MREPTGWQAQPTPLSPPALLMGNCQRRQRGAAQAEEEAARLVAETKKIASVLKTSPHFSPLREGDEASGNGEKKKVAFQRGRASLQIYVYNLESFTRFMQSPPVSLVFSRTAKKEQEEGQGHGVRVSGRPPSVDVFAYFTGFYPVFRLDTLGSAAEARPSKELLPV